MIIEFLGKIGVDPKLLIAQLVNFGLLLWILNRFLYKPLVRQIEKGEEELKAAHVEKEKLGQNKADLEAQKQKELAEAHQKAEGIIEDAQNIAGDMRKRSQKEIEDEKEKVLAQLHARLKQNGEDKE